MSYGHDEHGRRLDCSGKPINPDMGEGRWQDALRRMRARVEGGIVFTAVDSDVIGDKHTSASWGMCSEAPDQWPDPDDNIWPEERLRGRVASRHAPGGCPMDLRTGTEQESRIGCFYTCRIFTAVRPARVHGDSAGRRVTLALYDEVIAAREAKHGRRTKGDDNEPWAT